jgi:hypothetical protein
LTVDLSYTREHLVVVDQIQPAPDPTRLIFQRNGQWTGVLPNGLAVKDTDVYQDTNPRNYVGNPNGYLATYGHNFAVTGARYLFDLTTMDVYDMNAYSTNTLILVWPP